MMLRRRSRAFRCACAALSASLLWSVGSGCGGGGARIGGGIPLATRTGSIVLPTGAGADLSRCTVLNSVGQVSVASGGAFSLQAIEGGRQLAMLLDSAGNTMMLAFLDQNHQEISARSTAQVLVYFATLAYLAPQELQESMLGWIDGSSELDAVEQAISDSLRANPAGLSLGNPAVTQAVRIAAQGLTGVGSGAKTSAGRGVVVEPPNTRSGVRLIQINGINTIQLVNTYHRRAAAFIEQSSYVPEAGGAPQEERKPFMGPVPVAPTSGLAGGAVGTFADIFNGNMAYSEVSGAPIELPMRTGAKTTTYRVSVVGGGLFSGRESELTHEQKLEEAWTIYKSGALDVLLPMLLQVVAPIKTYGGYQSIVEDASKLEAVADFVNAVVLIPGFVDALNEGDVAGAAGLFWSYASTSSKTFQLLVVRALQEMLVHLWQVGLVEVGSVKALDAALSKAGMIFNALNVVNIGMTLVDLQVLAGHIRSCNRAEIWSVDVTNPDVVLTPATQRLGTGDVVRLKASVPEATGGSWGQEPAFVYHWKATGGVGALLDKARNHSGVEFDSTSNEVWYLADDQATGTGRVDVEVKQIKGSERAPVGTARSTIEVVATQVTLDPTSEDVPWGSDLTLEARLEPPAGPDTSVSYGWTCTNQVGQILLVPDKTKIVYKAGSSAEGTDTVTVEVVRTFPDGIRYTAVVKKLTSTLRVHFGSEVALQPGASEVFYKGTVALRASLDLPPPAGVSIVYRWTNTATVGHLKDGAGHQDTFEGPGDTATYTAGTNTGTDTITVEAYAISGGTRNKISTATATVAVRSSTIEPPIEFTERELMNYNHPDPRWGEIPAYVCMGYVLWDPVPGAKKYHLEITKGGVHYDEKTTSGLALPNDQLYSGWWVPAGKLTAWVFSRITTWAPDDGPFDPAAWAARMAQAKADVLSTCTGMHVTVEAVF